jgi:threonine/homoserine/homoserine lactone efflux protein
LSVTGLLPTWPQFAAFLVASFILAVTPGPGVIYIVTRSLSQGKSSGLASVAGVALGNFCNAVGASVGLATVFAISSMAFTTVKYAGAAYLVYLGIKTIFAGGPAKVAAGPATGVAALQVFRDGFVVALLNPKTALFFAAFLPQFMSAAAPPMAQSVMLGAIFVGIAAMTDTLYAVAAGRVAPLLRRAEGFRAIGRYLTGCAFIGLGLLGALAGERSGSRGRF